MRCEEIIKLLERQSPREYACDWDNVGLLVGRRDKEIKKIMIVVDVTETVCQAAVLAKVDMIISHHPVIFGKINRINDESVLGRKLLTLLEAGIVCYAMHTNFDTKGGMAKLAAKQMGLKNTYVLDEQKDGEGVGQIGILDKPLSVRLLAEKVKEVFSIDNVVVYGDLEKVVEKIAISPGSGKSELCPAVEKGAQCLITGDIGHHDGIDAIEQGLCVIDASHYGIEKIFMQFMYNYLKDYCLDVEIGIADVGVPFSII